MAMAFDRFTSAAIACAEQEHIGRTVASDGFDL
jgi:hypothetical protein